MSIPPGRPRSVVSNASGCLVCHSTSEWKHLTKFNHSHTGSQRLGSHRAVTCTGCHQPPNMELTMMLVDFADAPRGCKQCHQNPLEDQFGVKANDCAACRDCRKWRVSLFDHEKAGISLNGGHKDVACSACHTLKMIAEGKIVLFYKPMPANRSGCRGGAIPKNNASLQKKVRGPQFSLASSPLTQIPFTNPSKPHLSNGDLTKSDSDRRQTEKLRFAVTFLPSEVQIHRSGVAQFRSYAKESSSGNPPMAAQECTRRIRALNCK